MGKYEKNRDENSRQNHSGEGSLIAAGCVLDGTFSFSGPLTIAGHLKGHVQAEGLVIIEDVGQLEGTLTAAVIIIRGKVSGDVTATESLEIWSGSNVHGRVHARNVSVEEGSILTADLVVSSDLPAAYINTPAVSDADIPMEQPVLTDRPASPLPGSNLARKLAAMNDDQ